MTLQCWSIVRKSKIVMESKISNDVEKAIFESKRSIVEDKRTLLVPTACGQKNERIKFQIQRIILVLLGDAYLV